jgi:hypothetical protein
MLLLSSGQLDGYRAIVYGRARRTIPPFVIAGLHSRNKRGKELTDFEAPKKRIDPLPACWQ